MPLQCRRAGFLKEVIERREHVVGLDLHFFGNMNLVHLIVEIVQVFEVLIDDSGVSV